MKGFLALRKTQPVLPSLALACDFNAGEGGMTNAQRERERDAVHFEDKHHSKPFETKSVCLPNKL